jgi:CubicO group peptidase (beta-lactamase class C family)
MKRTVGKLTLAIGIFYMAPPAFAQDPVPRMQQIIQSYVADKSFMGTVLVVKGDKTLIDQGYGSADLEWNIPNVPAAKFRLGSVTKQFSAASILLLQERGKLKVEDPVKKYLPDAPAAWDQITIFNLLTHTSGIPSFTDFPDYAVTEWKDTNAAELVVRFRDKPLDFEPGTKFSYSNSGYVLLGFLIEKISGQSYGEFLQQNIFTPLGMSDSGLDNNSAILIRRAQGYTRSTSGIVHAGYISMTIPFSAGALYSTTRDLLKWERALFGGKVLTAASLNAMTTPFKNNYAFGLVAATKDGHKLISHGGGIEGFNTSLNYYPDDKLTVIVLGNLNGAASDQLADNLGKVALGQSVVLASERKVVEVSPKILDEYAGTYQISPTFSIVMSVENGQLMTQATGQPKWPIFASSETRFFLKVVPAEVEFFRDPATHAVTRLSLYQGEQTIEGKKQ